MPWQPNTKYEPYLDPGFNKSAVKRLGDSWRNSNIDKVLGYTNNYH